GFPLADVVVQLAESQSLDEAASQLDTVARLRLKRVGVSLGDFGAGQASIAALRRLPIDQLTLDSGFMQSCVRDNAARTIAEAVLWTARRLGLRSVAAGVEPPADISFLQMAGCDAAQGNLLSPPVPAMQAMQWLQEWRVNGHHLFPCSEALSRAVYLPM